MACTVALLPSLRFAGGVSIAEKNKAETGAALNATATVGSFSCRVAESVMLVARPAASVGVELVAPKGSDAGARPWIGAGVESGVRLSPDSNRPVAFDFIGHGAVTSRGFRAGAMISAQFHPVLAVFADYTADIASFRNVQPVVSHQISAGFRLGF